MTTTTHQWEQRPAEDADGRKDTPVVRCRLCGAYLHLSSGTFPCRAAPTHHHHHHQPPLDAAELRVLREIIRRLRETGTLPTREELRAVWEGAEGGGGA